MEVHTEASAGSHSSESDEPGYQLTGTPKSPIRESQLRDQSLMTTIPYSKISNSWVDRNPVKDAEAISIPLFYAAATKGDIEYFRKTEIQQLNVIEDAISPDPKIPLREPQLFQSLVPMIPGRNPPRKLSPMNIIPDPIILIREVQPLMNMIPDPKPSNSWFKRKPVKDAKAITIPLFYKAATRGDIEYFRKSENQQLNLINDAISPEKDTILHIAASFGHEEIVALISLRFPSLLLKQNSNGDTPLHLAAREGHLSVIRFLIDPDDAHVVVNVDPERGNVTRQNMVDEMVSKLNSKENSALHEAAKNGHEKVLNLLVEKYREKSFTRNGEGESPFYLAAAAGFFDVVRDTLIYIENNGEERFQQNSKTPLHAAIIGRHADVVVVIVEKAPYLINFKDEYGRTPLHYAAFLGFFEAVRCILQRDTSVAYKVDKAGKFPIHMAATKGHVNIIQHILEHCPDSRELLNAKQENFLHIAARNGKEDVVRFVLKERSLEKLINGRDCDENTSLHSAAYSFHPKIVSTLAWDKRVNKGLINDKGMTALDAAEHTETSKWFRKKLTIAALEVTRAPHARDQIISGGRFQKYENDRNEEPKTDFSKVELFKDRVNTLLVVATLMATMAFTAGFTMPGGYSSNDDENRGMAVLIKRTLFQTFVICNTIAMHSSIIVVITLIWAQLGEVNLIILTLKWMMPLLGFALVMVSVAFTAAVSLAVKQLEWLATTVSFMGLIFLICASVLFVPLFASYDSKDPILRYISYYNFRILLFVAKDRKNNAIESDFDSDADESDSEHNSKSKGMKN